MDHPQESRGVKRSNQSSELGKRRAPYALRACDACRRRKGKCDGQQPCKHCTGRRQACSYSGGFEQDDWQNISTSEVVLVDSGAQQASGKRDSATSSTLCNQQAILEMLCSLQNQLNNLASQVQTTVRHGPELPSPIQGSDATDFGDCGTINVNLTGTTHNGGEAAVKASRIATSQNFYGPTSPEYALNVAQLRLRREEGQFRSSIQECQLQLASIDDQDASEDDHDDDQDRPSLSPSTLRRRDVTPLLGFRDIFSLQKTLKLIHVYQEIVGDLHPVVDIDTLALQTRSWYSAVGFATRNAGALVTGVDTGSYELLLILNLVLAIALSSDSNPENNHSQRRLRDSFEDAVNATVTASAQNIKHVAIIFLKGWYDFFQDMPRSAWRMCGIAGRTLMELGFHNSAVSKYTLNSEARIAEGSTLMCSILIVDRQWSSATGLPTHFNNSSFSTTPNASITNPYLKAMLSFILISDQFSEPMSKVATGQGYEDEAAFELMTFQIEHWRKKAVGDYSTDNSHMWQDPSSRPPTWTILLNLRAKTVRCLLLKPFFFSEPPDFEKAKAYVKPAAELVHDMIDILYMLDTTTEIYRKQHPYYQHMLASACSLYFLLIPFIKDTRAGLKPHIEKSLADSFQMAVSLTTKYTKLSRSARRLAKRLTEMRKNLRRIGIQKDGISIDQGDLMRERAQGHSANTGQSIRRSTLAPPNIQEIQQYAGYPPPLTDQVSPGIFGTMVSDISDDNLGMDWGDSLRLQWPIGDVNNMFSESIF